MTSGWHQRRHYRSLGTNKFRAGRGKSIRLYGQGISKSDYEQRRLARIAGLRRAASRSLERAESYRKRHETISSIIPFGQPILVGHHSEGRHRRDIERIHSAMDKEIEERKRAEHLLERAESAESNKNISNDDPEAIVKLKAKISDLEVRNELMKSANKEFKKTGKLPDSLPDDLKKLALTNMSVWSGVYKQPFPSYELTSNSSGISRLKKRILELEAKKDDVTTEKIINGVRIVNNVSENRLQLFFPSIPSAEIRNKLKHSGFHWSPTNGCWQRFRSNQAEYQAEEILKSTF